ncbi:alpha/beta hydrolase [Olsenella sp. YH-ols2217]|uniref:Alpha/beta hydrolase n=1 Tax=Kribbibacterium absianum TaxID=3044210 RepID=A0ABT6ZHK5_9ACTN|nr:MULTISPECIES: alpha/beta hydrolase [unclassified Olsenella]MDJ1121045.1 alpha/beta hydrolase [Olsenella sp. YH-ols2216]MDJ1128536.1 alpha/beta hydrolase [Olsenella sp. YH-ols2217]
MRFHAVGKDGGAPVAGAPYVMLLSPELCGWWAMAAFSAQLGAQGYNTVVCTWDGFGEAADEPFPGIGEEAKRVCEWVEKNVPDGLRALVGCGMGGQVAVEALCEDSRCARALMVGDVLCEKVPGTAGSAKLTALAFMMMGAPAAMVITAAMNYDQIQNVMRERLPRVKKRRRYLASQMDGLGIPRALAQQFAESVAVTPRKTASAMTDAVQEWRIPRDISAIRCPVLVTASGLETRPYRDSAKALHAAIKQSKLQVARDLGRNELYLRYPQRGAEEFLTFLGGAGLR